ncbi:hypothetical protein [Methyloraptor flagellatus]|uniref:Tetratricopeptide repeat protein n=1 Tax=Methyloraptor flagellatus TaxID=3162530 RepID=A0AAU7X7R3_9HYPH
MEAARATDLPETFADLFAGIDPGDRAEVEQIFVKLTDHLGINAGRTFGRLAAGQPLYEALGLPRAALDLLYQRGFGWLALERFDRAEPLFRALCLLCPGKSEYWLGLGIAAGASGKAEVARATFDQLRASRPDWGALAFHELAFHQRAGRWDEAAEALRRFDKSDRSDLAPAALREVERLRALLTARPSNGEAKERT